MGNSWRFLEMTGPIREIFATEEALLESAKDGPIIMVYRSDPHSISLSTDQSIDDIDLKKCKKFGIEFARRITGGGSVYHHPTKDFSYAIIAPAGPYMQKDYVNGGDKLTANTDKAYREFCGLIEKFLRKLGLPDIKVHDKNYITSDGRLVSGSAMAFDPKRMAILQHGYVLFDEPLFPVAYEVMLDGGKDVASRAKEAASRTTYIREHVDFTFEEVMNHLLETFQIDRFGKMTLSLDEQKKIQQLLRERDDKWHLTGHKTTKKRGSCVDGVDLPDGERGVIVLK